MQNGYTLIENEKFDQAKSGNAALEQTLGDSHPELSKVKTAYEFEKAVAGDES